MTKSISEPFFRKCDLVIPADNITHIYVAIITKS